jgi:hypothetical protein
LFHFNKLLSQILLKFQAILIKNGGLIKDGDKSAQFTATQFTAGTMHRLPNSPPAQFIADQFAGYNSPQKNKNSAR